jgi:hypothetical protein
VAPVPLLGMMKMYEEEFREHVVEGKCRCGVCPNSVPAPSPAIAAD